MSAAPEPPDPAGAPDPLGSPLGRAAFEAATQGLLVLAPGGTVLAMNAAFGRLYGVDAEGHVGRPYSAFADGLEVRRLDGAVGPESWVTPRALRGERVEGVRQTIRNGANGREFTALCGAAPLFEGGRLVATTIVVEDVTAHVRAQQAVEGALSAAEVGTYRIDLVERRIWGDANFARIHGLAEEEASGGPLERVYDLMHPDDLERVASDVQEATRRGGSHELEYRIELPDGGTRWVLSRGRAEADESGAAVQRIGSIVDVTARRSAEEGLRLTQESLGLAMRGSRMGWWRRDLLTGEVVWSPELEAIFGLEPGSYDGSRQSFLDFVHSEDREALKAVVARAIATGEDYTIEFRFRRTDGSEGWMEGRGKAFCDDAGRPVASYGIGVDVTKRREAEQNLRLTGETFERLVQNSPFGIYVVDADFRLALVSQGAQKVFERVRPLIGREFAEVLRAIWEEPFASEAIAAFRRVLETGEPFHSPRTVERRSDVEDVESYDWRVERIAMPDGRNAVVCHFYDLSERLRYEAALYESEARLRLALETARLGTWDHDVASGVTRYSEAVGPMFGRPREPLSLSPEALLPYIHPDDRATVAESIRANLERGEPYRVRIRVLGDDGAVRWVESKGELERDAEGGPLRVRGVALDVSEQVEAERALRESNERLERAVRERTEELTRANRDLDQFAYSVAHDLRAPLRSIVSSSRMLVEDAGERLTGEERATLDRQVASALRLAKIVDDLLGFARLADAEPKRIPFDLTALARRSAGDVALQRSGCAFEVQEGMRAVGDPSLVGYVLTNLLDNACKFSPKGGTVTVGEEGGAFFVRDEGMGFDMAHAGKLFVAFERLVGQEIEGTGVGLANVRRIVERHGGGAWAESEPGEGATFWFTLG